jgi:hypothetical protein
MGTAHGTAELGMCSHGVVCQAGARGRYIGSIILSHDFILTNVFLRVNRGTLQVRIAVSRE